MNTYGTSPTMALSMARYHATEPGAQAEARATLRALRAERRAARTTWNPFAALVRAFSVAGPAGTPAHSR